MIQLLTHEGNTKEFQNSNVTINRIHDAQSLDDFEINVINLQNQEVWRNAKGATNKSIDIINDFKSLSKMIDMTTNTTVIILLPQNLQFKYDDRYQQVYKNTIELKDMIFNMKVYILKELYEPFEKLNITYENTKTQIIDCSISAAFCFEYSDEKVLTRSTKSNRQTTIDINGKIVSTLNIANYEELIKFLRVLRLIEDKETEPEWIKEIRMFDDNRQLEVIEENNLLIKQANDKISEAMAVINKNKEYKSILYTNGDELVNVVFSILEEMLGCNLARFEDKKKEDFLFDIGDHTFIGEIKGVNHNVKSENVSQLDVHYQSYLENHEEKEESKVSALLIMNHQKNKPLGSRASVHEQQINLAKRNGSLIIETITLLRMFERYLDGSMSRDECIELLSSNIGLLTL